MVQTEDPQKVARPLARDHLADALCYAEDRVCRVIATVAEAIARRDQRASLTARLDQYAAVEQALPDRGGAGAAAPVRADAGQ